MISRPPPRAPLLPSTQADRSRQREARGSLLDRILNRARADERVLALLDYGSTSEGRGDAWSDIDLAMSIRPDAWEAFNAGWRDWLPPAGRCCSGLRASLNIPPVSTEAAPVRVDLHLTVVRRTMTSPRLPSWPNAPVSTEAMLPVRPRERWRAGSRVGRAVTGTGERRGDVRERRGHFWYYVHRTWSKLH